MLDSPSKIPSSTGCSLLLKRVASCATGCHRIAHKESVRLLTARHTDCMSLAPSCYPKKDTPEADLMKVPDGDMTFHCMHDRKPHCIHPHCVLLEALAACVIYMHHTCTYACMQHTKQGVRHHVPRWPPKCTSCASMLALYTQPSVQCPRTCIVQFGVWQLCHM